MPRLLTPRLLSALALGLAGLASLAGLALASLDAQRLRRGLDEALADRGLPPLKAAAPPTLRWSPGPTLVLREVELAPGADGRPGLHLDELRLSIGLLPWWRDERLQPQALGLRGLRLQAVLPAGSGPADWAGLLRALPGLPPLPWPALTLDDLRLELLDPEGRRLGLGVLEHLEGQALAAGQSGRWTGRLRLEPAEGQGPALGLSLATTLSADPGPPTTLRAARLEGQAERLQAQQPAQPPAARLRLQAQELQVGLDGGAGSLERLDLQAETTGPAGPGRATLRLGPARWQPGAQAPSAWVQDLALDLDGPLAPGQRLEASLELPRLALDAGRLQGDPLRGSLRWSSPAGQGQALLEAGPLEGTPTRLRLPGLRLAWTGQSGGWTHIADLEGELRSGPAEAARTQAPAGPTLRLEAAPLRLQLQGPGPDPALKLEARGRAEARAGGLQAQGSGQLQGAAWQARLGSAPAGEAPGLRGALELAALDPATGRRLAALLQALPPGWAAARLDLSLGRLDAPALPLRRLQAQAWLDAQGWGLDALQAQAWEGRVQGRLHGRREGLATGESLRSLVLQGEALPAEALLVALGEPPVLSGRGRLALDLQREAADAPWQGGLDWRQADGRWTALDLRQALRPAREELAVPAQAGGTALAALRLQAGWPGPSLALQALGGGWQACAQGQLQAAGPAREDASPGGGAAAPEAGSPAGAGLDLHAWVRARGRAPAGWAGLLPPEGRRLALSGPLAAPRLQLDPPGPGPGRCD